MGFIHTIILILFEIVNVFSRIAKNGDELGRDSMVSTRYSATTIYCRERNKREKN